MPHARSKILIINGNPDAESFCFALQEAYKRGASTTGAEIRELVLRDLKFDPNLAHGYRKRTELEPDLVRAAEWIRWAEHLVVIHPVWWGSLPAVMKGFFDRVFLPGFFFEKIPSSKYGRTPMLKGRSARIIYTLNTPRILWWLAGRPSYNALKWTTLDYCGVSPVRGTAIGIMRLSTSEERAAWVAKVERLGARRG